MKKSTRHKSFTAIKIAVFFLVIGILYILFSDWLLLEIVRDTPSTEILNRYQSYKGIAFIVLTSILIYVLVKREVDTQFDYIYKLEDQKEALIASTKRLESTRKDLSLIFESSEELIATINFEGFLIKVNPAWQRKMGWSDEELLRKPWINLVHPEDVEESRTRYRLLREGVSSLRFIIRVRKGDGNYAFISWNVIPLPKEKVAFAIGRDITQEIIAQKRLGAYKDSLKSLTMELTLQEEKQRKAIAENIHDHLSQSLVISKMKLKEIMNEDDLNQEIKEELQTIIRHVGDALNNSRRINYDLSPPVLYELGLIETLYWLKEKIETENKVKVLIETDIEELSLTESESILLFRSIQELIRNALKHGEAERIRICFKRSARGFVMEVEDNGRGFDTSTVFENGSIKRGFGIFKVRERITNLSGEFSIESTPGKGTMVKIFLPLTEAIK